MKWIDLTGKVTPAQVLGTLKSCFNCAFPVSGAPKAFPATGQRINLNASPFTFINVPAPVVMHRIGSDAAWYFTTLPGHFDGEGSSIAFRFYQPDGNKPSKLMVDALILKDRGGIANAANAAIAGANWQNFVNKAISQAKAKYGV